MVETVIALLMIVNNEIKEHRIQPSMSECLKGKRIAMRDTKNQVQYQCITGMSASLGIFIGILSGLMMALFTASVNRDYLYFSEYISDKIACSVPDKQTFRCNVYKGHELIGRF